MTDEIGTIEVLDFSWTKREDDDGQELKQTEIRNQPSFCMCRRWSRNYFGIELSVDRTEHLKKLGSEFSLDYFNQ